MLRHGAAEHYPMRPSNGSERVVCRAVDPGHHVAVVEPEGEITAKGELAFVSDNDTYEIGCAVANRHEVEQRDGPLTAFEGRLEHQAIVAIATVDLATGVGGEAPAPVCSSPNRAAKQAWESKRGQHSQSIEPSSPTSAAVSQSPMSA